MKIITATNDDKKYLQFAKLVPAAWKKLIPEADVVVGHVSWEVDGELDIPGATVENFTPDREIPTCNLAKVSRLILASTMKDEVCLLTDMDMAPLNPEPFRSIMSAQHNGSITCYGGDAYEQEGRFPICYLIGKGETFRKLINPKNLSHYQLLTSWKVNRLDDKDNIAKLPFSDESLVRALIKENDISVNIINRGWVNNIARGRMDRTKWAYLGKDSIDAHLPKPYERFRKMIRVVERHLGL